MKRFIGGLSLITAAMVPLLTAPAAVASSHREAPFISGMPRVDGTDFYMFNSYETGRSAYVTLIANYDPLQDPYGGPNYYLLDPNAIYEIHVDNNGDATSNLTFRFKFTNTYKDLAVPSGGKNTPVPLSNIGPVTTSDNSKLNVQQTYTVDLIRGNPRTGTVSHLTSNGNATFTKPMDNIGNKSFPNYANYASQYIYNVDIPGCSGSGKVFVGQRKDGFVVNLGEIFDLVNTNPAGPRDGEPNTLHNKNVTSLALEIPKACLTGSGSPIIGGWTTASIRQARVINPSPKGSSVTGANSGKGASVNGGAYTQVSRLGAPLVNEVVIGLPDKDRFNASQPKNDAQFAQYVTNPSLPVLLNALYGSAAKVPGTPRNDLVSAFLTGVKGLNQPPNVVPSEELRLNTSIAATPPAQQSDLGVLGGDNAGFPNGRRPYDDVVDIALRVVEGALCGKIGDCGSMTSDPNNGTPYTDGAEAAGPDAANSVSGGAIYADDTYMDQFPYLATPIAGSPN